jgi:hypothetical protein
MPSAAAIEINPPSAVRIELAIASKTLLIVAHADDHTDVPSGCGMLAAPRTKARFVMSSASRRIRLSEQVSPILCSTALETGESTLVVIGTKRRLVVPIKMSANGTWPTSERQPQMSANARPRRPRSVSPACYGSSTTAWPSMSTTRPRVRPFTSSRDASGDRTDRGVHFRGPNRHLLEQIAVPQ